MTTRRHIVTMALATPFLANVSFAQAQTPEKPMSNDQISVPHGPANRSLAALERSWVVTRFYSVATMEEGRTTRDIWPTSKLNVIRGNLDIRDPANGELLQKVQKGVRVPHTP